MARERETPVFDEAPEAPKFDDPDTALRVLKELHTTARELKDDVASFREFKVRAETDLAKAAETMAEMQRRLRGPGEHSGVDFGKVYIPEDVKGDNAEVIKCFLTAPAARGSDLARYQELNDSIVNSINAVKSTKGAWLKDLRQSDAYRQWRPLAAELQRASGDAMDTLTAGEGLEWVTPPTMSTRFIDLVRDRTRLINLLPFNFTMATHDVKFPGLASDSLCYVVTEQTASTSQTKYPESLVGTRARSFSAKDWAGRVLYSRQSIRDLTPSIAGIVNANLQRAWANGIDRAFINGDDETTHMDNGQYSYASPDMEVIWPGLRYFAIDPEDNRGATSATDWVYSGGGDAVTVDDLAAARKKMGKYGGVSATSGGAMVIVPSLNAYFDLVADSKVQTVDKLGAQATLVPGELARLHGAAIVPSSIVPTELDSDGTGGGVAGTLTTVLLFDVEQFSFGLYQGAEIMASDVLYMESGQIVVIITGRGDFQPLRDVDATGNADKCVYAVINILS